MKYLKVMRVKHYLKNLLVFFPIIFSGMFFNYNLLFKSSIGFIAFSLLSSIIYILNDLKDIEKDRKHPIKKKRPIASGEISKKEAIILMIVLGILIFIVLFVTKLLFDVSSIYLLIYFIINFLYSFGLKNIPILDITILSFGFVLRILYGGIITSIPISNWLYLTTLSMAFYMALGKRRNELIRLDDSITRNALKYYTKDFLEKNMYMFLTLSIVFYSLWATIGGVNKNTFGISIIMVIIILMKYNMKIESEGFGDPVDVIFSDKILMGLCIIYACFCFCALYIM